ncbi:MAG: nuclear transport factor 2 family protein [Tahibacter sp.]
MQQRSGRYFSVPCVAIGLALAASAAIAADEPGSTDPLFATIANLDTAVFDAFNHCDVPGQLNRHESYFARDVEFYHDNGGVTWTRNAMLANTRKHVCGHFSRELIAGSLKVYPIKDFGAIETGVHRFCQFQSGNCEGMADFTIVWRKHGDRWEITRVLSYGHRANVAE